MKPQSAKSKGRKLQKYAASRILDFFHQLDQYDVVSRPMGSAGPDLMFSSRAQSMIPVTFECKNTGRFPSVKALKQVEAHLYPGSCGAVIWKPPRLEYRQTLVYLTLDNFLAILAWRYGVSAGFLIEKEDENGTDSGLGS